MDFRFEAFGRWAWDLGLYMADLLRPKYGHMLAHWICFSKCSVLIFLINAHADWTLVPYPILNPRPASRPLWPYTVKPKRRVSQNDLSITSKSTLLVSLYSFHDPV